MTGINGRDRELRKIKKARSIQDEEYRKDRDDALRSLDINKLREHMRRWGRPLGPSVDRPDTLTYMMHFARVQLPSMSAQERLYSAQWLTGHGYRLPNGFRLAGGIVVRWKE